MKATIAFDKNRLIGNNGSIPWNVPEDLKFFKNLTLGKTIIIGSNTYRKFPLIKNRKILVLSKTLNDCWYNYKSDTSMATIKSPEDVLEIKDNREIIVAGGAQVYQAFMPYITEFYVTHIHGEYSGDVHIPTFEHFFSKQEVVKEFDLHKVIKYTK